MHITYSDPRPSSHSYIDLFASVKKTLGYERTDAQLKVITQLNDLISAAYPYYGIGLHVGGNAKSRLNFLMSIASASTQYTQMYEQMQSLSLIRIENLMYQASQQPTMRLLFSHEAALKDYSTNQQSVSLGELTINSDCSCTLTAAGNAHEESFTTQFWQCSPPADATRQLCNLNGLDLGDLGLLKTNADLQVRAYLGKDLSALEFILRCQLPQL